MICCDGCEEWFHGKCVGITMEQGKHMEKQGKEYVCDKCRGNLFLFNLYCLFCHDPVIKMFHCVYIVHVIQS